MEEPVLRKAMNTLEFLSQDAEARRLYEDRQKYLHDEASMLEGAMTEGLEKGLEKGREQGREQGERKKAEEMARKLLVRGVDISIIAESSGLTEEEIKNLGPIH